MKIELIRHGETPWMPLRKYQGRTDVPLSEEGIRKLQKAAYEPEVVYVSAMKRAAQTAKAIFPKARQIVISDFSEMDFGDFEGRTADEMQNDSAYREWVDGMCLGQCPGGESKDGFCERVCRAFTALLDRETAENKGTDLIIVSHGGTVMAIMERFAFEKRSFYEWYPKSGCGYLLDAGDWTNEGTLKLISDIDHNMK